MSRTRDQERVVLRALTVGVGLVVVGAYALLWLPGDVVDRVIEEDSWVEMAGAVALLAGGVLAALAARRLRRAGARSRLLPLSCAALALALLFAAGEEVSWLQRQLGLATPEPLSAVNLQDELNVHNVLGLERVVEIAAAAMWVGFALVVPLLARTHGRAGEVVRRHLPVIPLALGLLFLLNNLMADVAIGVGPQFWRWDSTFPLRHSVTEIEEAVLGVLYAASCWWVWRTARPRATGGGRSSHARVRLWPLHPVADPADIRTTRTAPNPPARGRHSTP